MEPNSQHTLGSTFNFSFCVPSVDPYIDLMKSNEEGCQSSLTSQDVHEFHSHVLSPDMGPLAPGLRPEIGLP